MKPDPVLEALEAVAAQFGKADSRGIGLGLDYDQVDALSRFADAVSDEAVKEFQQQLLVELKRLKGGVVIRDDFASGQRVAYSAAIYAIMNSKSQ